MVRCGGQYAITHLCRDAPQIRSDFHISWDPPHHSVPHIASDENGAQGNSKGSTATHIWIFESQPRSLNFLVDVRRWCVRDTKQQCWGKRMGMHSLIPAKFVWAADNNRENRYIFLCVRCFVFTFFLSSFLWFFSHIENERVRRIPILRIFHRLVIHASLTPHATHFKITYRHSPEYRLLLLLLSVSSAFLSHRTFETRKWAIESATNKLFQPYRSFK